MTKRTQAYSQVRGPFGSMPHCIDGFTKMDSRLRGNDKSAGMINLVQDRRRLRVRKSSAGQDLFQLLIFRFFSEADSGEGVYYRTDNICNMGVYSFEMS